MWRRTTRILVAVLVGLMAGGCTTPGYPLKLHSNPEYATVCFHAVDGWSCNETPYNVYFPDQPVPLANCFETIPFQFTWQSGAQTTTTIRVCPGNSYYVANRPNTANLSTDVMHATRRTQKTEEEAVSWVDVLGLAVEGYVESQERARENHRTTFMDCTGRDHGNRVELDCTSIEYR